MNWTEQFDGYCERTDLTYWSEPVNAVTNAAFLLVAIVMWYRCRGGPQAMGMARVLAAILFAIGVGSYLFHTHATAWAGLTDVVPIALFILVYVFVACRAYLGWPVWAAGLGALGFIPYAAGLIPMISAVPFLSVSAAYWPVAVLIAIFAVILRRRLPQVARGLGIGAAILVVSLIFRTLDEMVCAQLSLGTHFLWHILNAIMLGWMIELYRRHILASIPPAGTG